MYYSWDGWMDWLIYLFIYKAKGILKSQLGILISFAIFFLQTVLLEFRGKI